MSWDTERLRSGTGELMVYYDEGVTWKRQETGVPVLLLKSVTTPTEKTPTLSDSGEVQTRPMVTEGRSSRTSITLLVLS